MTMDNQIVLEAAALISGFIAVWVHIHVRIRALEIEVKQLQRSDENNNKKFDLLLEKIELMNQKFNELILEFTKIKQ